MTGGKKEGGALNAGVCQTPRDVGTHSGAGGSMCEGAGSLTGNPHTKHSLPSRLRQTRTAAGHQTDYEGAWRRLPSLSIPLGPKKKKSQQDITGVGTAKVDSGQGKDLDKI